MKKIAIITALLISVAIAVFYLTNKGNKLPVMMDKIGVIEQAEHPVDEPVVAYFVIFTNGTRRTFADSKYLERSPVAYLTAENPEKIIIKNDVTWQEFFDTLPSPFEITPDCLYTGTGQKFCSGEGPLLVFYLNGKDDRTALSKKIAAGDKLLVSYGSYNLERLNNEFESINTTN